MQTLATVYLPMLLQLTGTQGGSGGVLSTTSTKNSQKELLSNMQKFLSQVHRLLGLAHSSFAVFCMLPALHHCQPGYGHLLSSCGTGSARLTNLINPPDQSSLPHAL